MSTTPTVFASPASLAEHGSTARAVWAAVRRMVLATAVAFAAPASRPRRSRSLSPEQVARRRLVQRTLEQERLGSYVDAALSGPRLT